MMVGSGRGEIIVTNSKCSRHVTDTVVWCGVVWCGVVVLCGGFLWCGVVLCGVV